VLDRPSGARKFPSHLQRLSPTLPRSFATVRGHPLHDTPRAAQRSRPVSPRTERPRRNRRTQVTYGLARAGAGRRRGRARPRVRDRDATRHTASLRARRLNIPKTCDPHSRPALSLLHPTTLSCMQSPDHLLVRHLWFGEENSKEDVTGYLLACIIVPVVQSSLRALDIVTSSK
jgi:hypothetical protein